jgi:hypothetical protein
MTERDPIERDIEREEAEAAREAAEIGGRSGMEDVPEEERPLAESGGGEAEGFEQAEEMLKERASHEDDRGSPLRDRPHPEGRRQGDRRTARPIALTQPRRRPIASSRGRPGWADAARSAS